jgi:hypothetical protein
MGLLAPSDLDRFARDGYLVVPGVVAEPLLAAADEEIDRLLGAVDPDEGDGGPGPNLWFVPRDRLPAAVAVLVHSAALEVALELVAPFGLAHASGHVQVATTVPPYRHVPAGPHVDGHGPGQHPPGSFTLLAGVLFTDQRGAQSGNLWVWPGSHLAHARLFAERGTTVLEETGGHPTLLAPPPELGSPVEVRGGRGDLVLAHYLVGHNKGGNTAAWVRRTLYYRLAVPGHAARWESTFLDPFTEYPALRGAAVPEREPDGGPGGDRR